MYVKTVGRALLAAEHGQGQEVVLAHRRLRLRPRPAEGRQAVHGAERRPVRRRRAGADRLLGLLDPPDQDPQRQARPRRLQPRRQPDHQLPQAVLRVRPRLPGGRLRLRHGGCLGRGQGQLLRHLAARVASPDRHARLQEVRRRLHRALQQAAREPGVGRLHRDQDPHPGDERRPSRSTRPRSSSTSRRSRSSTCSRRAKATSASTTTS